MVAGVDEVGRGSWAGPVVAAAVILPLGTAGLAETLADVRDSKCLEADERERLARLVRSCSVCTAIGWSSHHVVDSAGLGVANRRAMTRAVRHLSLSPHALLVDAMKLGAYDIPAVSVVKGDSLSLSIAAASILAKVVRDGWMKRLDARCPHYEFGTHKGYGTPSHRDAIARHGISRYHRRSFRPLMALGD